VVSVSGVMALRFHMPMPPEGKRVCGTEEDPHRPACAKGRKRVVPPPGCIKL